MPTARAFGGQAGSGTKHRVHTELANGCSRRHTDWFHITGWMPCWAPARCQSLIARRSRSCGGIALTVST